MGKLFDSVNPALQAWIAAQRMFFVASAPLAATGLVNCSPKGMDSFRVLGPLEVAYLDLTGSGIETIAHVQENQRLVLMWCAFEGAPKIVRLHGRAEVVMPQSPEWAELVPLFPPHPGARAIVRMRVERVSDSCGYAVPLYDFVAERDVLTRANETKGPATLQAYRNLKNASSIDGLLGLKPIVPNFRE